VYACPYCRQSFNVGGPPPQAAPPPVQHQIIITHHHGSDYDSDPPSRVSTGAAWNAIVTVFIVFVVLASAGGLMWRRFMPSSMVWNGKEPFSCGGNDEINLKQVNVDFSAGTALVAAGNCKIKCVDCVIKAPIAVEAAGNAEVTFVNGSLVGSELAIHATGNAHVNVSGNATVTGPTKESGNAHVSAPKPTMLTSQTASASAASAAPPAPSASSAKGAGRRR
jgi:hypothetical protein